jgi:hypothetical protein
MDTRELYSHGAAMATAMTHNTIPEQLDGEAGFLFPAKMSPLL